MAQLVREQSVFDTGSDIGILASLSSWLRGFGPGWTRTPLNRRCSL